MSGIDYKFVLTDELLKFDFDVNSLNESMKKLSGIISKVFEDPKAGLLKKKLGDIELFETFNFYDLIYFIESPVDRDFKRSLSALMNNSRASEWDKKLKSNECVTDLVERSLRDGELISLLALEQNLGVGKDFLLVCDEQSLLDFYRKAPKYENSTPERFIEHAKRGFPGLYFMPDIHREITNFQEPYNSIRDKIIDGLAYLNDRFITDANEVQFLPKQIEARFRPCCINLFGISPESSSTMSVEKKKRLRIVKIKGQDVVCQWHVKISSQYDRIHFAFEENYRSLVENRIIIGIFTRHLDT